MIRSQGVRAAAWRRWAVAGILVGSGSVAACSSDASMTSLDPGATGVGAPTVIATLDEPTSSTVPASTLPSSTLPSSTLPSSTVPSTLPPKEPIVLGFAGDTSFTDGLEERDPFGAVIELLSEPDLMMVNLETAVADPDVGRVAVDKPFLFKSPPSSLGLLVEAGIDVVGLANNHTLDFGPDAVAQTLAEVDAVGLYRVGAGNDEAEAYRPLIVEVGDWRVGLVALSRVPCDWSWFGENVRPQVAWACAPFLDRVDAMVAATVTDADVTVAMVHGGAEGVLCPSEFMVEITGHLAELGVDAVVNGHPHVVQGLASAGDTIVARSSGNFAFPSARGITANSAVFLFDVREGVDGGPELGLRIEPVRTDGGVVRPPSEDERAAILDQIARHSSGWVVGVDGVAEADPIQRGRCDGS